MLRKLISHAEKGKTQAPPNKAKRLQQVSIHEPKSLNTWKEEEWADISQFDGYYSVSNYGRIWAVPRPFSRPQVNPITPGN